MEIRSPAVVHFAGVGVGGDLLGELEQVVRGVAHRGDDHDEVLPGPPGGRDTLGHLLDAFRASDGGPAVLLDEQGQGGFRALLA
jgi:hypothetical protein